MPHVREAVHDGTVRIVGRVGRGVMLAVHGHPLARAHTGGHPDDRSARQCDDRAHRERAVRQRSMQVHGRDRVLVICVTTSAAITATMSVTPTQTQLLLNSRVAAGGRARRRVARRGIDRKLPPGARSGGNGNKPFHR